MNNKHILKEGVQQKNTHSSERSAAFSTRPSSTNGFNLSTEQLHNLLTKDHESCSQNPFDKAVEKQQKLLKIINTLDRQNTIHQTLDDLLNSRYGIHWLDQQINLFKSLCPGEILSMLRHIAISQKHLIPGCDTILHQYHCLLNELIHTPLKTLANTKINELNEYERNDWYNWCSDLDRKIHQLQERINDSRYFFTEKTFDKIYDLTKDTHVRQQLGSTKHLFLVTALEEQNV